MITLSYKEWERIRDRLTAECPPSVMLMRTKMKAELGFTPRFSAYNHQYSKHVFLDFFDDTKETFFRMKYINYD